MQHMTKVCAVYIYRERDLSDLICWYFMVLLLISVYKNIIKPSKKAQNNILEKNSF